MASGRDPPQPTLLAFLDESNATAQEQLKLAFHNVVMTHYLDDARVYKLPDDTIAHVHHIIKSDKLDHWNRVFITFGTMTVSETIRNAFVGAGVRDGIVLLAPEHARKFYEFLPEFYEKFQSGAIATVNFVPKLRQLLLSSMEHEMEVMHVVARHADVSNATGRVELQKT